MLRGIGLYFDMRNPPRWQRPWAQHYADTLEVMAHAEELGADEIWLTEHHFFEDGYLPQPLAVAAAAAARTTRIRIGTAVCLPLLRHPLHLAEEAAVVDIISGGRLDLGLGTGYRIPEFRAFDTPETRRFDSIEHHIRMVRNAWAGVVTPAPLQDPLPLWGGFFGRRGAHLAGRLGMGLLAAGPDLLEPYRDGLSQGGFPFSQGRLRSLSPLFVADDPEAVWALVKPHVDYLWNSYRWYGAEGTPHHPAPLEVDRWRPGTGPNPWFVLTDVAGAVDHLVKLADRVPVEAVYCWSTLPGLSDEIALRHRELLLGPVRSRVVTGPSYVGDSTGERKEVVTNALRLD